MVLRFSDALLNQMASERFLDRVTHLLGEHYPAAKEALSTAKVREILRQQYNKAIKYGLRSELDVARYIITAWLLGIDFDTRFKAMNEFLTSPELTPTQKAEAIERTATTLLETLNGGRK